jgi:hypothetical protein
MTDINPGFVYDTRHSGERRDEKRTVLSAETIEHATQVLFLDARFGNQLREG